MKVKCIKCWGADAIVSMDLDEGCLFRCSECSEEFDRDDVRAALDAMVKGWAKVLAWADQYPSDDEGEEADPEGGE